MINGIFYGRPWNVDMIGAVTAGTGPLAAPPNLLTPLILNSTISALANATAVFTLQNAMTASPDFKPPATYNPSFGAQRELGRGMIAYVGFRGIYAYAFRNVTARPHAVNDNFNLDLALTKEFSITERVKLQLNLNFSTGANTSAAFGTITSAQVDSRRFILSAKIRFQRSSRRRGPWRSCFLHPFASSPRNHYPDPHTSEEGSECMSQLAISFHGGSTATSVNNLLSVSSGGALTPLLVPDSTGAMPALSELRGFFTDPAGTLYVVNAYKNFSNILSFKPSGGAYAFDRIFASGSGDGLAHPFCAVLAPDGDIYVSNQDVLSGQTSSAITRYEGPSKKHPGKYKGVFIDGFTTLRGIATDGKLWYVADEGNDKVAASVGIFDGDGKPQDSLSIKQPVHLLYDGSQYLYIGSEKDNAVYRYDCTNGGSPAAFVTSSSSAPIDHTSGLALAGGNLYVGSRKGMSVNQYPLANPSAGSVAVSKLVDNPEFVAFL